MITTLETWAPVIGHLLTASAVGIAALQLKKESERHRENRLKEQDDRMRVAAARSLAKLERRRKAYIDYFTRVKPFFIDVSERRPQSEGWQTERDYLWKKSEEAEASLLSELMQEEIESDYVELAGLYPHLFGGVRGAVENLDALGTESILKFRREAQTRIQQLPISEATSVLSSALRTVAEEHAQGFARASENLLGEIRADILKLIESSERPRNRGAHPRVSDWGARASSV